MKKYPHQKTIYDENDGLEITVKAKKKYACDQMAALIDLIKPMTDFINEAKDAFVMLSMIDKSDVSNDMAERAEVIIAKIQAIRDGETVFELSLPNSHLVSGFVNEILQYLKDRYQYYGIIGCINKNEIPTKAQSEGTIASAFNHIYHNSGQIFDEDCSRGETYFPIGGDYYLVAEWQS